MKSEHLPSETYDDQEAIRDAAIADLAIGVIGEIQLVGHDFPHDERFEDKFEYVSTLAQLSQLQVMGEVLINVARERRITDAPLPLIDEAHFDTLESQVANSDELSYYYYLDKKPFQEAIAKGMRAGTDTILQMLVPKDILATDPAHADVYFLPWVNYMLDSVRPSHMGETQAGAREILLPTTLPDIYIAHVYSLENKSPIEEIRVIDV